jgi:hypothetical protein
MDEAQRKVTDALVYYLLRQVVKANARGMRAPYTFQFSSRNGTGLSGIISEDFVTEVFDDREIDWDFPITLRLSDDFGKFIEGAIDRVN